MDIFKIIRKLRFRYWSTPRGEGGWYLMIVQYLWLLSYRSTFDTARKSNDAGRFRETHTYARAFIDLDLNYGPCWMEVHTSSRVSGWNRNKSFTIYGNERGHRVENEATKGTITPWAHCFYKRATPFVTQREAREGNRQLSRLIIPPVKRSSDVQRTKILSRRRGRDERF